MAVIPRKDNCARIILTIQPGKKRQKFQQQGFDGLARQP
jgi:hypothetical protein